MAKSWATVVRGFEKPAVVAVSKFNPLAAEWKPREVHKCVDCGHLAQMCQNGCDRPGNRSIVPRLARNRFGERQWGEPKWVCAGCHFNHEHAISQMPYMDMGPLPDPDTEGKLPFLCVGCAEERSLKECEAREARYQANKKREERVKRAADEYLATLPKLAWPQRDAQIHEAYKWAFKLINAQDDIAERKAAAAAGGGAA